MKPAPSRSIAAILLIVFLLAASIPPMQTARGTGENKIYLPLLYKPFTSVPTIIPETTVELTDETASQLTSISSDGATYTFVALTPELQQVDVGDVIISGISAIAPEGFLRKVTSRTETGGGLVLVTEQASVEEAFQQVSVDVHQSLTTADIASLTTIPGITLEQPSDRAATGDFQFQMNSAVLYDKDNDPATTDDQITANGSLTFSPEYIFRLKVEGFTLRELYFSQTNTIQTELTISSGISVTRSLTEINLLKPAITLAAFPVPGLPFLVVTPQLQIKIGIDGSVYTGVSASVTHNDQYTAGVQYWNHTWTPIHEHLSTFDFEKPDYSYGVSFTAYAGPELSFYLNGVAGPYLAFHAALKLEIEPAANPWLTLKAGLEIPVGVSMEIFSHTLVDVQLVALEYWQLLYSLSNSSLPTTDWNTFMGSPNEDFPYALAVDRSGNTFITGKSSGSWGSPVNPYTGGFDVFVAKFNGSGVRQWVTFLGSSNNDEPRAIDLDGSGNIYLAGSSLGTWGTSPKLPFAGGQEAFVAKLNGSGVLQWNTFLGSAGYDEGDGLAVDNSNNVHVAGFSQSSWGSPTNPHSGSGDAFVAKLNSNGALQRSTFLGPGGASSIAVDGSGNAYISGISTGTWGSPVNPYTGNQDGFAVKLNSSGTLSWNTFFGSSGFDHADGIAVDGSGYIYITGYSVSTWGAPINAFAGLYDAFVMKINNGGTRLWNTFMGSAQQDDGYGITVDGSGNIFVTGDSYGTWGSPAHTYAGTGDAFVAELNSDGVRQWNTFYGGSDADSGAAIAVNGSDIFVAGNSYLSWGTPVQAHAGGYDGFIVKLH